jgi:putative nucleotidyltransferase with HDIG domain
VTAPRFVTRALVLSFLTVALILGAAFTLVSFGVRDQVRASVADNLAAAQQVFTRVEARRQQDLFATVSTLTENPTLKAALDTWLAERTGASAETNAVLLATVQREVDKIADRVSASVLAVADSKGVVVVSGGRQVSSWPRGSVVGTVAAGASADRIVVAGEGAYRIVYRVLSVPLQLGDTTIGSLELGTALDTAYAAEVAQLSRGHAAILRGQVVLATTLEPAIAAGLAARSPGEAQAQVADLAGEAWAIQPLSRVDDVTLVALASIDDAAERQTSSALTSLAWIGLAALGLAGLGSLWLARTLTEPIDHLSRSLTAMSATDRARTPVAPSGSSREIDQLTQTFNSLMASVTAAEAEAEATYLGAVRALAAALDARDPYTAGHSERVSTFAVAIGEELGLDDEGLETLRLGALLHDVGKIGVPDEVLRKQGALTPAEFEAIKIHPSAGARILRSIPFLAPHIPIVELHHERPDGQGYPYGLVGAAIPLAARIVHVADAFDAMTSARAYRAARLPVEAIAELRRGAGTDFDGPSVEALVVAVPRIVGALAPLDLSAFQWAQRSRTA